MPTHIDLSGSTFNGILVLSVSHKDSRSAYFYQCRCHCGKGFATSGDSLKSGRTKSCGCISQSLRHGRVGTSEYGIWNAMKARCMNPNTAYYKDYGGRGVRVCERWMDFRNFYADMGERPSNRHSIDRYPDNDGNYEPGNVRWATRKEQALNRRNNKRPRKCECCATVFTYQAVTQKYCSHKCKGLAARGQPRVRRK